MQHGKPFKIQEKDPFHFVYIASEMEMIDFIVKIRFYRFSIVYITVPFK